MKVILVEPIKYLGGVGDTVNVKPGFARNYLIPQNLALYATDDNVVVFEKKRAELEKRNQEQKKAAEKRASALEGKLFTIVRQAGEDGRLYGSVNAKDIVTAITAQSKEVLERREVHLTQPIKYIGVYAVPLQFHAEVAATVHINVARSEEEAKDHAERFARGETVMEGQTVRQTPEEVIEEVVEIAEEAAASAVEASTEAEEAPKTAE